MRKNTKLLFSLIGFLCLLGLGALLAFTPRGEARAAGTEQEKKQPEKRASGFWGNPKWDRFQNCAWEEDPARPGLWYCFI